MATATARRRGGDVPLMDRALGRWIRIYIPILALLFITLFPFYWMAITTFKSPSELFDFNQSPLFVRQPTLEHWKALFLQSNFPRWTLNTTIVAIVSTAISLFCSVLAGYSLARLRFRGANAMGWGIFVTYLVPPTLLFLPLTFVIRSLHLFNNLLSLILTYPTFLIPFCTWLLIGYFKSIPRELEESALVDGATRLQAMMRVVIPLALPGILSAGMFAFTLSWNEFLYSLIFMNDSAAKTIPVGVTQEFIKGDEFFWGVLMAGGLLGALPLALLFSFFFDHLPSWLTPGAVN